MVPQEPSQKSVSEWIDVGGEFDWEVATAIEVIAGKDVIAIFFDGNQFHALDGLCAHQGGPISKGQIESTDQGKSCVTCPWHGWQYELETGIQTVNRQPLQRTFPTRIVDGRVQVGI